MNKEKNSVTKLSLNEIIEKYNVYGITDAVTVVYDHDVELWFNDIDLFRFSSIAEKLRLVEMVGKEFRLPHYFTRIHDNAFKLIDRLFDISIDCYYEDENTVRIGSPMEGEEGKKDERYRIDVFKCKNLHQKASPSHMIKDYMVTFDKEFSSSISLTDFYARIQYRVLCSIQKNASEILEGYGDAVIARYYKMVEVFVRQLVNLKTENAECVSEDFSKKCAESFGNDIGKKIGNDAFVDILDILGNRDTVSKGLRLCCITKRSLVDDKIQATRRDFGIPSDVILFNTLQPIVASCR